MEGKTLYLEFVQGAAADGWSSPQGGEGFAVPHSESPSGWGSCIWTSVAFLWRVLADSLVPFLCLLLSFGNKTGE